MQTIKVLIVDDEPLARDIIETYILKIPELEIIGKCKNALEAFGMLSKQYVDLIFLDINMPEISGIDFLKTLKNPPNVIFTTAYSEFAVESYELNAIDYLVKPIAFDRFLKAMNKTRDILQLQAGNVNISVSTSGPDKNILFVKSEGKLIKIDLQKLWFVEGLKNYLCLWTESGKIVVHSTMKNIEDTLAGMTNFIRVNKSYIANIAYISEVDGNVIRIKDQMITIGNTYRDEVHKIFDNYKLL